jgi:UDP-N-acetylenolpyruvoylglucosamine reductase
MNLADLTTLRLGGPARHVVDAESEADLIAAVRDCDERGEPVLVLGGGSNLVVADDGFDGTVVRVQTRGVTVDDAGCGDDDLAACGGLLVKVAAGENWDDLVARAGVEGWIGVEALSGIPGAVGATPMQNVGAYGQEVAETIWAVRTYDRADGTIRTFANAECAFDYRTSRFKGSERFVILDVSYQLLQGSMGAPIRYAELARALDVEIGARAKLGEATEAEDVVQDTYLRWRNSRDAGLLIEAGADVNKVDREGSTALMFGAQHGRLGMVKSIVAAGADPGTRRMVDGLTARDLATGNGHDRVAAMLLSIERLRS